MIKDIRTTEEKTQDIENAILEVHEYLLHKDGLRLGQRIKSNIEFMTDRIGEIQSRNIELRQLIDGKFATMFSIMMVQSLTILALMVVFLVITI